MFATTSPILPSRDLDANSNFYKSIGFEETGHWEPPLGYMITVRKDVEKHFNSRDDLVPLKNSGAAYIRTSNVDRFSDEVAELGLPEDGCPGFCAAGDMSRGMREASVLDPDGHLLRVGQFLDG